MASLLPFLRLRGSLGTGAEATARAPASCCWRIDRGSDLLRRIDAGEPLWDLPKPKPQGLTDGFLQRSDLLPVWRTALFSPTGCSHTPGSLVPGQEKTLAHHLATYLGEAIDPGFTPACVSAHL